jgi:hypothetical protein
MMPPRALPLLAILLTSLACSNAPAPVNPSFPTTFSEAKQALHTMSANPRPLDRPRVVIGGFLDPNVSPPLYKMHFRRMSGGDDRIVTVSVGFCGSFDECRQKVLDAVDRAFPSADPTWTTEVDVVGASLGGLVARYAAAPSDDPAKPRRLKIARLFSISSPQQGATLADAVGFTQYHRDMRPGSPFMKALAAHDAQAAYRLYPYVRLGDEIVGEQYAAPPDRAPLWLPNPPLSLSHAGAMIDPRILADIGLRLRGGPPRTPQPPPPPPPPPNPPPSHEPATPLPSP